MNTEEVWVAVTDTWWPEYKGVKINIITADNVHIKAWTWDTGYFAGKCVEQVMGCAQIVFDLHIKHWQWGSDTSVMISRWWVEDDDVWWGKL